MCPLTREQKGNILKDLVDKLGQAKAAILVDFTKLPVSKAMELRRSLKKVDAEYKVAKKTLMNRAFRSLKFQGFDSENFKTQVGLVLSFSDPVPAAQILYKFSRAIADGFKILGGFLLARQSISEGGGLEWKDKSQIIALAQLPSREVLLAKLARAVAWPLLGLVGILSGNMRNLAKALDQIQKSKAKS